MLQLPTRNRASSSRSSHMPKYISMLPSTHTLVSSDRRVVGSMMHATTDNDAAAANRLPQDVLASVLLRLPASDLRRSRHVCMLWRDVISDPTFIREHMVHGPRAPTHTVVFYPFSPDARACGGFLFDEQWRLAAKFTVPDYMDMVGTCKGLLYFLDVRSGATNVVEPFTGEWLVLPPPPETGRRHPRDASAYCFGFDPKGRRFKIVYCPKASETAGQEVYVYTIGGDRDWTSVVHPAGAATHGDPVCVDGAAYWSVLGAHRLGRLARLDLATEEVTYSDSFEPIVATPSGAPMFGMVAESDARLCLMTMGSRGELDALFLGEGGRWVSGSHAVTLPARRYLSWPHALQRGHLLLEDRGDRGLYAHTISGVNGVAPPNHGLGEGKLLEMGAEGPAESLSDGQCDGRIPSCGTRPLFVPVRTVSPVPPAKTPAAIVQRVPYDRGFARTFGYVPPVYSAPLALYLSTP